MLSIDADERVSEELAAEIRQAYREGLADAYEMPRLSTFCGRPMRHSGWYPDYVLRLFRRERARFSDDLVHERVICDGKVARLKEPLTHHPVVRLEDSLSRMDRYSTARARDDREFRPARLVLHRHPARLVDFHPDLLYPARLSRWPRGLSAGSGECRRYLLSLHEGVAEGALAVTDLISVIVTTWNREDALDAVLRSLAVQTDRDFEVIIADDGSGEGTAKLIADWVPKLGCPLKHVWQEHRGFRAAEIRNRAILASARHLLHLSRRRLHRASGLHRDPSQACRARAGSSPATAS